MVSIIPHLLTSLYWF